MYQGLISSVCLGPGGRFIDAEMARTMGRGEIRTEPARILFLRPWITKGLPWRIAGERCRPPSAGFIAPNLNGRVRWFRATAENSVAVAPGQLTVAETPVPLSSYQSASVKEFTKALLA